MRIRLASALDQARKVIAKAASVARKKSLRRDLLSEELYRLVVMDAAM
jgi:hypothetical protein